MRIGGFVAGLALWLAPVATAADDLSNRAIGYICSAEHDGPLASSQRQLVMVAGVGTGGFSIANANPRAQAWFNYGMQLAHAFYHEDAKAAFRRAEALDPHCAMCVWGEAWSDGPTINYDVGDQATKAAGALAGKAALMAAGETPKNRALTAALELRYASHDAASATAFAKAMDAISRRYPDDDEAAVLTCDAWLTLWRHYDDRQGLRRAVEVLEPVLTRHPDNTAAIHFYIHATEIFGDPAVALPYAERLGALAPGASHLVHMASHTFFRVGRYEDAAVANAAAIGADGAYLRAAHDPSAQGAVTYHGHDLHFGLAGAMAAGDAPLALRFAAHARFAYPPAIAGAEGAQLAIGSAYAAYGRYDPAQALALPEPGKAARFTAAMRHYARGEAFAAKGDAAAVRAEAARMDVSDHVYDAMGAWARNQAEAVTKVARLTLLGRAAMLEGDPRGAAASYRAAVAIEDARLSGPGSWDPPPWWFPERRSLAAALLAAGDPTAAVATAREALRKWPREPLTLEVLAKAEEAAGEGAAARRDLEEARRVWRGGPVPLTRI